MNATVEETLDFAERVLGPCDLVSDHTWAHRRSSVLCLQDAQGARWFLKRHGDRDRHEAEVRAYREWVPALGANAPSLRCADHVLPAIIVAAVPAEPAPWSAADGRALSGKDRETEQRVQREAGRLLRRFHEAKSARPWPDFGAAKLDELNSLMPVAAGLLSAQERARVHAEVAALNGVACPGRVPCHRDYTPRNWLVGDGAQFVVDFEWARLDVWISDLARLHLGIWASRPDLQDAFMSGYGRQLSAAEHAMLRGCAVLTAVWLMVKARESRQRSLEDGSHAALRRLLAAGP